MLTYFNTLYYPAILLKIRKTKVCVHGFCERNIRRHHNISQILMSQLDNANPQRNLFFSSRKKKLRWILQIVLTCFFFVFWLLHRLHNTSILISFSKIFDIYIFKFLNIISWKTSNVLKFHYITIAKRAFKNTYTFCKDIWHGKTHFSWKHLKIFWCSDYRLIFHIKFSIYKLYLNESNDQNIWLLW